MTTTLAKGFKQDSEFLPDGKYKLLPFRFSKFLDNEYIITNYAGEYLVIDHDSLHRLVDGSLQRDSRLLDDLRSKHFIYYEGDESALDLLALKYRTKIYGRSFFTSLHIIVLTLRCDYSCQYCQVSRQTESKDKYDMSFETANRTIDMIFRSPSPAIKIEFQGGETLLNFELLEYIVLRVNKLNKHHGKHIEFVVATNLSMIDDNKIEFFREHNVYVSTSLDGTRELHDKNRPKKDRNGYELTVDGIRRIQSELGVNKVSALMTTTLSSLSQVKEIIDEYIGNNLHEIFLRPLSPYGFAVKTGHITRYDTSRWIQFYKIGLGYIIDINKNGYQMVEQYASIILKKILTPQDLGYVDLQSPSGAVTSGIVFNYDGEVYASDEARMLAEMTNKTYMLGNVHDNTYEEIIGNNTFLDTLEDTMTISSPQCTDCAYINYCGSDPLFHYATQNDPVGHKPTSGFCQKNMAIFEHLIDLLENGDEYTKTLLKSWTQ